MAAIATATDSHTPGRTPRAGAWLLIAPLILWLIVFVIAPIAIMIVYSFCDRAALGGVQFNFSVEGYKTILHWPLFKALGYAICLGGACTAALIGAAIGLGRFWAWLGDWMYRRWKTLAVLLMLVIGWGFFRQYVLSRVENINPEALNDAQKLAKEQLGMIKVFVISIDYAAWSTLICVVIGYPVAYFMGRASQRVRNLLMLLIMVPFWTSFLIRTYAWVTILNSNGPLNDFLLWAKIISEPMDVLYTGTAVMIGLVYTYLPFMILPIYTSCERLDQSMIEASFDLGANPFRSFWTVILPLTWPGVVAGVVITFIPAIGMFAVNVILGGNREPLIGNVIDAQFKQARNWPQGAALGMVLMMMFVVTYYVAARKRGTVVG